MPKAVVAISVFVILIATFFAGLMTGRFLQHQKTGYFYQVRSEKTYPSPNGNIRLEYATESVGFPFLDPGTITIVLEEPSGTEFVLYKVPCGFQEPSPWVEELNVTDNHVQWDDGCNLYTLQLERSERSAPDAKDPLSPVRGGGD